ncbi:LysR family transcriptional regulator [Lentisalinibacter orientalis]|uniref:LysR family transcriptional regulator n=1 Tax=Lentisalinibacter orientalis TaxID=2992241 RepID=UPI00386E235F
MNIDLTRLRYLVAAVEHGNIKKAAETQHITQSALTRSIQKLERDLGAKLLERQSRGVVATPIGKRLCEHAKRIVNVADAAFSDIEELVSGSDSPLRLGICPTLLSNSVLAGLMRVYESHTPRELYVVEAFHNTLIQLLRLGELDLVLTSLPEEKVMPGVIVQELRNLTIERSIFAYSGHELFSKANISQSDIQNARWVFSNQAYYIRGMESYFDLRKIPRPKVSLKTDSLAVLRHAIVAQSHVALLSSHLVARHFREGSVRALPGTSQTNQISHALLWSRDTVLSPAAQNVVEKVRLIYNDDTFNPDDTDLLY